MSALYANRKVFYLRSVEEDIMSVGYYEVAV